MSADKLTAPERIRAYVARHCAAKYVDEITSDLIDVATGKRAGTPWEQRTVTHIFRNPRPKGPGVCRAFGCDLDCAPSVHSFYCQECEELRPICPACGGVYAEHDPDCPADDGYEDSLEGPWYDATKARNFAYAECGAPHKVVVGRDGQWYLMTKMEEED